MASDDEINLRADTIAGRVAELEQAWGFRAEPPFNHNGSWVARVEMEDGSHAVLKLLFPHDEARFEAAALRVWNGCAAVRLFQASEDGFALLLERCVPGTDLWSVNEAAADDIACQLLPWLWQNPGPGSPFDTLAGFAAGWWNQMPHQPPAKPYEVNRAAALGQELAVTQQQQVLLHGDFHPGNVLAASREPWLVIDPKPLVGEPAFDLAQWLYNRCGAALQQDDPLRTILNLVERFAAALALDPVRIAGWAFVKSLAWDWGPACVSLFSQVLELW